MSRIPKPASITGLKAIHSVLADGTRKTFYYHRATGIALGNDHALAMQRVAEINALKGPEVRTRQAGSLAALVVEFRQSPEHVKMANTTKALWRPYLVDMEERLGNWTPEMLTLPLVSKLKALLIKKHGSGSARNRFKCYSRIWNWGRANGLIRVENPFMRPGSFATSNRKPPKKPIWRKADIEAFLKATRKVNVGGNPSLMTAPQFTEERVPDDVRMALLLGLFTLQRQADVLSMRANFIDSDRKGQLWMTVTQHKTREVVRFPLLSPLVAELKRQKIEVGSATPLVGTKSGKEFDKSNFYRKFSTWLEAAGITTLDYRALRRSGMVWLAEAGVSTSMIAALSGHAIQDTQKILDTYIVKTEKLAAGATDGFEKILKSEEFRSLAALIEDDEALSS
jgi:integrase